MENFLIHYTVDEFQRDLKKIVSEAIREQNPKKKETSESEYITRKEVSEKLHISFPTLNRLHREGILVSNKIGGRVLYLWSDVEKAINQNKNVKYRRN